MKFDVRRLVLAAVLAPALVVGGASMAGAQEGDDDYDFTEEEPSTEEGFGAYPGGGGFGEYPGGGGFGNYPGGGGFGNYPGGGGFGNYPGGG
ncbi:hypothetical protein [Marinactinospora rubrisoli]|uniref:Uncharacterized protein n=1 Tax=Marinactinospora rubrisoli TaxID=2715399 RepID=A0ABW2KKM2_9ACTN